MLNVIPAPPSMCVRYEVWFEPTKLLRETETFVYLKLNKQHYNWGTR